MSSLLLTAPAAEPLSLDEARDYLRVETNDDDALMGALIAGARIHVEAQTRRALITQSWRLSFDWPEDGRIDVVPAPLRTLNAARVYDGDGDTQALDTLAFVPDLGASALVFMPLVLPAPGRIAAGIELDVTVGYGDAAIDVPEALRQAVRLLVAHWYENRRSRTTALKHRSPRPSAPDVTVGTATPQHNLAKSGLLHERQNPRGCTRRGRMFNMVEAWSSLDTALDILHHRLPCGNIRVYEAGGGSMSCLPLQSWQARHITVVDIDEAQLQNNSYADTKILGDIQEYKFPEGSFDLIVCYNVLEHLSAPDRAIALFFDALAAGGLLFIGAPNPNSFSGVVTKRTPYWLHVAYYRWICGQRDAGHVGKVPFRTVYHPIVSPRPLASFCEGLGFEVVYLKEYEALHIQALLDQRPLFGRMLNAVIDALSAFSADKTKLRNGDFHAILKKPDRPRVP
jgi:uncharacterized phiE125 gp8 family phage protein